VLVDNDLSAYSGACRPEYERLLDLVRRREIDVIVAYHPDRLYRRLADLVELTKVVAAAGVEIRTVAAGHVDLNTASGRFTAQVLGAAAEHESARIGERFSAKHHQNAERGNAHGGGAHQLVASIETDEQFLADLAADYGAQRINRAQFLAAQDPIHARLLLARRRLDQLAVDASLDDTPAERVTAETWDLLTLDQQRALVGLFIDHVVIRRGKRGRCFDPSRVQPVPVEKGV